MDQQKPESTPSREKVEAFREQVEQVDMTALAATDRLRSKTPD